MILAAMRGRVVARGRARQLSAILKVLCAPGAEKDLAHNVIGYIMQEWPGMTPNRMRTELELVTPGGVEKMLNPVMRELAAGWQAQGMAQGMALGEARGKAEVLKQILHQRFPNKVPRAFERRIDCASLAMIEVWCREVYRVKSVEALAAMTEPEPESDDSLAA